MVKRESKSDSFVQFIGEQLSDLPEIRIKAMFGGHGIYSGPIMFGILAKGRLYFRVDDVTRKQYVASGMGPFMPYDEQAMKSYYEVPPDCIESPAELLELARQSIVTARKAKKK